VRAFYNWDALAVCAWDSPKQHELAKASGLDVSTLSRWEQCGPNIVCCLYPKLLAVLDVLRARGVEIARDGSVRTITR
jgi:hypothetical protein